MSSGEDIVPGVALPPRKEHYFPIVRGLRPMVGEEELMLRSSLLLMRDRAMATKPSACEPAWALLDVVERQASDNAMNHRCSVEDLRTLRRLCVNCVMAASGFDALFEPRLPINEGEAEQ